AKEPAGGGGGFAAAGGQRRDLEVIGERLQRRNMRLRRPTAIRIGADDADTNPLGHWLLPVRTSESAFFVQPVLDLADPLFTGSQRCEAAMHRVLSEHEVVSVR